MAQKKSILIVDDDIGPRESLKMALQPIYQVHTAADGQEALKYIQNEKIDLVTLDLKMPGLPGIEVLKEIKKRDDDIEVIVITAYGTPQNAQEATRYGAGDFIPKPFNVSDLLSTVSKSMERRNDKLRQKNFAQYNSLVIQKQK
ncbi:MAG: response regulator [Deltaproteobacteria bacterium]|nr:response regulator [Deltaproteobacteria bacterium]